MAIIERIRDKSLVNEYIISKYIMGFDYETIHALVLDDLDINIAPDKIEDYIVKNIDLIDLERERIKKEIKDNMPSIALRLDKLYRELTSISQRMKNENDFKTFVMLTTPALKSLELLGKALDQIKEDNNSGYDNRKFKRIYNNFIFLQENNLIVIKDESALKKFLNVETEQPRKSKLLSNKIDDSGLEEYIEEDTNDNIDDKED